MDLFPSRLPNSSTGQGSGGQPSLSRNRNCSPSKKKSWQELKAVVCDLRRQFMSLSSMIPTSINFRNLSDGRTRIYFLSTPPNGFESTLLYADVHVDSPSQLRLNAPQSPVSNSSSPSSQSSASSSSLNSTCSPQNVSGTNEPQKLQWNLVLEPTISSLNNNNPCSREVQLMMERKRLSTWGITSFELHKQSGKIVYPASSSGILYQCLDTGFNMGPLFPSELRVSQHWAAYDPQHWAAFDPQICPQNSDLVAYVCSENIWVTHTVSGHVARLTNAHDGQRPYVDGLSIGIPSYVIQEEFNRYQGFWWQPMSENNNVFRIVFEEVDESEVGVYTFPSSQSESSDYEEYRFPRAGTPNAKSKLKLVQFTLSESLKITEICVKDLHCSLSFAFPWVEYLVRVGWTPDSKFVWVQLLDRPQQRLDIVLIPLDNFCEPYSSPPASPEEGGQSNSDWKSPIDTRRYTPMQVIYSQTSDTWVNVHDLLHFLEITDNSCTFIWANEETGFRHLYLITSALNLELSEIQSSNSRKEKASALNGIIKSQMAMKVDQEESDNHCQSNGNCSALYDPLTPQIINKVPLTAGDWEILGNKIWVDEPHQIVYFQGLRETPLEKHLYAVSLQQPLSVRLLTNPGFSYTAQFNDECTVFMQIYCNILTLPTCEIVKVTQTSPMGGVNGLSLASMGFLLQGGPPENSQYCPTIYNMQLSNEEKTTLYAMVFKPHNFKLGVKYPTILNIYGGPEVQIVNNSFKGMRQLRMHMLAAQGYCVVCIDSRGSHNRGVKFESYIRKRMGTVELADQVDILKKLSEQLGYLDMSRVAIHGWSYGGYLSLMGLVHYPDVFKLAIAGAPVTNWEFYDTGYTERYMGLPDQNKEGYIAGSVLNYVYKFPDEENRLLIIHGLIDENVHFYHTSQLISALIRMNKPHQLQVYPNERHSLRNLESSKHYETTLLSFLQNNL